MFEEPGTGSPPTGEGRFARFAAVGASGIAVNLATLFALADVMHLSPHLASAGAIAVSIGSNFFLNDAWTFADRRETSGRRVERLVRYYVVSLGGAAVQWGVFVAASVLLAWAAARRAMPLDGAAWKYLCQLTGIAAGTAWNFTANLRWTWRDRSGSRAP